MLCFRLDDDALDARHHVYDQGTPDDMLRARALACYALYRTHNGARHNTFSIQEIEGAFQGYVQEGRRHSPSD